MSPFFHLFPLVASHTCYYRSRAGYLYPELILATLREKSMLYSKARAPAFEKSQLLSKHQSSSGLAWRSQIVNNSSTSKF